MFALGTGDKQRVGRLASPLFQASRLHITPLLLIKDPPSTDTRSMA